MVYDILPSVNLTGDDIRDTLNANGGNVTNDAITWFQDRANINKWARNKPERHNTIYPLTEADRASINYGIKIDNYPSYKNIPNAITSDGQNGWDYQLPRGAVDGLNEYLRISDFVGYYPLAASPVTNFNIVNKNPSNQFPNSVVGGALLALIPSGGDLTPNLTVKDFKEIQSCYFGMYAIHNNGVLHYRGTSDNPVGNNGLLCELNCYKWNTGEWVVYPFFSLDRIVQSAVDGNNQYFTVPNTLPITINVRSSYIDISVTCTPAIRGRVTIKTTLTNNGSSPVSLTNNNLWIRLPDKELTDPLQNGESVEKEDDVTLASGETKTVTNVKTINSIIREKGGKVFVAYNSGQYEAQTLIMIEVPTL